MPLVVSITHQQVYTLLRALVTAVVPVGVAVIQGLGNRTPLPAPVPGFVAMTVTGMVLHRTPVESWERDNPDPDAIAYEQGTLIRIQLDCYGSLSGDWAIALATVLRTEFACRILSPVTPLFSDEPMQAALINSEEQYEQRWIVGANLQYNPVVSTPMEFADALEADLINVDVSYPP